MLPLCKEPRITILQSTERTNYIINEFSIAYIKFIFSLVMANVPVNNFSVMSRRSHRFQGVFQYYGYIERFAQGDKYRTQDHSLWSLVLHCHDDALPDFSIT